MALVGLPFGAHCNIRMLLASSNNWSQCLAPAEDHLTELLTDNGTAFSGEEFGRFAENWGIQLQFWCTYVPSGNGIVERCHCTIKRIAARTRCSVMETLYWYNVMPKDDAIAPTAPANAIFNYCVRVKGIDTAPPLGHVDSMWEMQFG